MTDRLRGNNLKDIFCLFVDGLPALNAEEKAFWKSNLNKMTPDECVEVMDTLFEQTREFLARAGFELNGKPEAKEELASMEIQAKTLLEKINADLIALHLKPLQ